MKLYEPAPPARKDELTNVQDGIAVIVDGDTCPVVVQSGMYAYIKNNTHGLAEGLYKNISDSAFPTSGGTADGTVFEADSTGGLNALNASLIGYPDYSNQTNLSSYSSSANRFTAPSNGYIFVISIAVQNAAEAQGYIGNNKIYGIQADAGSQWQRHCPGLFPIKAGNTFYHTTNSVVPPDVFFVPFIS